MHKYTKSAVIIGGGPAGCQCALWLKTLGLNPIIIEKTHQLGGLQNDNPYTNNWLVGQMNLKGRDLAHNMQQHIEKMDITVLFDSIITHCQSGPEGFTVSTKEHQIIAPYLVIATGARSNHRSVSNDKGVDYDTMNRLESRLAIGWEAELPDVFQVLKDKLLDERGFIITDDDCCSHIPGIYAIGEAANRMPPCVATAMADGVIAAKAIQAMLTE